MKRSLLFVNLLFVAHLVCGQAIFAHNDYVKPKPFYAAFELKVAYIEADVFLYNGDLVVAHTKEEIDPAKTLETMYLKPLLQKLQEGNGKLYGVTLMIDLKTEGAPTMAQLIKTMDRYPDLKKAHGLTITMSGGYPPPAEWKNYPDYIFFDGRPKVQYTADQLKRINLISTSYNENILKSSIDFAHNLKKPIRFWAAPDNPEGWAKLIDFGVDVLNSDNIDELSKYLKTR